jgi:hypothetical protein
MTRTQAEVLAERLRTAALTSNGVTGPELRREVHDRARAVAMKRPAARASLADDALLTFVDGVATRSNDVSPDGLLAAGKTEDEVFETAVVAAVAAGLVRMEEGLRAAREK